jgi:lysophospholipase L1-like esterase
MPDKHSNNKPEVSQELIRQYLAGELDDKAMHALERQALDDPFLAEALEGYAGHEQDQSAQLAELQQRLEQRVEQAEKGKLRLLYYRWASAAAILAILGLSFLWINRQQSAELQKNIAKTEEARPAPRTYKATDTTRQALVPPDAAIPAGPLAGKKAPSPVAVPPPVPAGELKKDYTPEVALEAAKARDSALAAATERIASLRRGEDSINAALAMTDKAEEDNAAAPDQQTTIRMRGISTIQQALQGKAAGVTVSSPSERFFNGRVVDKESGEPVPGVNVIAGNKAVITDSKGAFAISMDTTESPSLKLASIGYNSQQLSFRQQENNVTVAMEPSKAALNEVVVTGMGRLSGRAKRARKAYQQRQPAKNIVVLGSSTAAGTGPKTPDSAWVNLLRKYLQSDDPAVTVTNLAVGGFTSYKILPEGGDLPFYKPKPDLEHNIDMALSLKPDLIIINMPSNDITDGFSVEDFRKNLQVVTDLIRQQNIRFYITTTQPRNTTAANRKKLRQMRDIIMRSYRNNYIDCWDELSTPDGNIVPLYDSGDGVHLNGLGHRIMFERVAVKVQ